MAPDQARAQYIDHLSGCQRCWKAVGGRRVRGCRYGRWLVVQTTQTTAVVIAAGGGER